MIIGGSISFEGGGDHLHEHGGGGHHQMLRRGHTHALLIVYRIVHHALKMVILGDTGLVLVANLDRGHLELRGMPRAELVPKRTTITIFGSLA